MENDLIFTDELFDQNKPNFNFLKSLHAKKKLKNSYRLKKFSNEDQEHFSPNFSLSLTNNSEYTNNLINTENTTTNFLFNVNMNKKNTVKVFNFELFQDELTKISLIKEIQFNSLTSCIEISNKNLQLSNVGRNFTAVGTFFNGISIWNTDKIINDEPLCILKDLHSETYKKNSFIKKSYTNLMSDQKEGFVSCLRWNPNSLNYILEATSNGCLRYWDIVKGETIFEFFLNNLPISSLNWRNFNKNEIVCLSGNYISCLLDIRNQKIAHKIVFEEKIKGVDWLNCENLYTIIGDSGLICLKDIRFHRGNIYSKNIYKNKDSSNVEFFQFSPGKKNLLLIDKFNKIQTFCLNGVESRKTSCIKIKSSKTKDFVWINSKNGEKLIILNDNSKYLVIDN